MLKAGDVNWTVAYAGEGNNSELAGFNNHLGKLKRKTITLKRDTNV